MTPQQPNNPLHGITLRAMVEDLVERHGFEELGRRVKVRCFTHEPSVTSSLKFLRKTDWARGEVEQLYLQGQRKDEAKRARNRLRAEQRAHSAQRDVSAQVTDAATPDDSKGES